MIIELTKGLGFSAAHFIVGHERCEHLHGHNWRVGVKIEGEPDERGLIVDFIELKRLLKNICESYDHRLLLPANNKVLKRLEGGGTTQIQVHGRKFEFPSEDVVWLPVVNTTVEEIARIIGDELSKKLAKYGNVKEIYVSVDESPGQGAQHTRKL